MTIATLPAGLRPAFRDDLLRLGSPHDGGYVLTRRLIAATDFLLSFGISVDWSFERAFRDARPGRQGVFCHGYDHTVSGAHFRKLAMREFFRCLSRPHKASRALLRLHADYKAFFDGRGAVHFRERIHWRDGGRDCTIATAMGRVPADRNVFLKMDIEGGEYRVLADALPFADRIVGMAIEFHEVDILTDRFMDLIGRLGRVYDLVHVHANNFSGLGPNGWPVALELTYERKDLGGDPAPDSGIGAERTYPLAGLDGPNDPGQPDIGLRFG